MGDTRSPLNFVKLVDHPIDIQSLNDLVASPEAGAISTFSGTTRNHHNGKKVLTLHYEAYASMAEEQMNKICHQIREKWDVCWEVHCWVVLMIFI